MRLRIFGVTGEALNFARLRFETILRVVWLPALLLIITSMATVYAYMSVLQQKVVTFSDVALSFDYFWKNDPITLAAAVLNNVDWQGKGTMLASIMGLSLLVQAILQSSMMAPLIRLAALGQEPERGAMHLRFGPQEIRLVLTSLTGGIFLYALLLGPAFLISTYVFAALNEAYAQTIAYFPDPNSLHLVQTGTRSQYAVAVGETAFVDVWVPMALFALVMTILFGVLMRHFHPKNRGPHAGAPNTGLRALTILVVLGLVTAFFYSRVVPIGAAAPHSGTGIAMALSTGFGLLCFYYFLRLFPWPGVSVAHKSLRLKNVWGLSRGWNIFRIFAILGLFWIVSTLMIWTVNSVFLGQFLPSMVVSTFNMSAITSRLTNGGETATWILPTFIWAWTLMKLLINVMLFAFILGAIAGMLGRFARQSEHGEAAGDHIVWAR